VNPIVSRVVVVPVVRDDAGRVLLCRMAADRGVFPDQWGLPGGGVEPGEAIHDALCREVGEEVGASARSAQPLFFKDGTYEKLLPSGERSTVYMLFLLFDCRLRLDSAERGVFGVRVGRARAPRRIRSQLRDTGDLRLARSDLRYPEAAGEAA
jgi:8-oxo-dGTP pyrophosphatase MutT (NUDIX family)